MTSRLRDEGGFGLVELLIAMTVMSVGIFALVAGFSSGYGAVNRASTTSTAGALADQQMETLRRGAWDSVIDGSATSPDGKYSIVWDMELKCPDTTTPVGSPPGCTLSGGVASRPVKQVVMTVTEVATAKVLFTESTTFDQSTG